MFRTLTLLSVLAIPNSLLRVAAEECNRFSTNGSAAATYDFYRFYDFRNLDGLVGDAGTIACSENSCLTSVKSNGQSKIITASPWSTGWDARYWLRPVAKNGTIDMYYSPSSISISMSSPPLSQPL